jgi:signal transduction histidine kinase
VLKSSARALIDRKVRVQTSGLTPEVPTDAKWAVFILRQLIDNSVKYGASSLEFSAQSREANVALLMRDNGVGIPAWDIDHIFEKGFTGENGRRFGQATGLGLYLSQKLCAKLGMEIRAYSQPGEGTTMELIFPRRDPLDG